MSFLILPGATTMDAESEVPEGQQSHSVTRLIERLKRNDPDAARLIWQRFFDQLLPIAQARLRAFPDRSIDAEDVLVSVFDLFFRAAREDHFAQLNNGVTCGKCCCC